MVIALKSETDSRYYLYPLMKCLWNYGTIGLYTSNPMCSRLIENELEGGFKNIRVIVDVEADLEGCKDVDQYYDGKYDFLILDNMGAIDYDIMIAIITGRISQNYMDELLYIISDDKTHVVKLGAPAPVSKERAVRKGKAPKGKDAEDVEEDYQEEEDDSTFNKWRQEKSDEDILKEKIGDKSATWCKPPTWQDVENMEGRRFLAIPDRTMIKDIYRIFGTYLSVDERQFTKGAEVKDESSSDITGTDVW